MNQSFQYLILVRKPLQWLWSCIFWTDFVDLLNTMVLSNAARAEKYRSENKEKTALIMAMQQMKRSKLLQSGTPEANRVKQAAALRKQLQRQRDKERNSRNVSRRMTNGAENEGPCPKLPPHWYH